MRLSFSNMVHSHYTAHHHQQLHSLPYLSFPHIIKPSGRRPPPCGVRMDSAAVHHHHHHHQWRCSQKDKILVIMGATGCGKSRLSIDLATRFFDSEIINTDKMQVYKGLDITTNKIPVHERLGVSHHFLGEFDPKLGELNPSEFRLAAGLAVSDIVSKDKLPILVGGSNSFIHALLVARFKPEVDVFNGSDPVSTQLRYDCRFLWVDVSFPVLCDYLCKRVDEMLDSGMFDELSDFYYNSASQLGLKKAIGVPEFDRYFKKYPPGRGSKKGEWDQVRRRAYEEAVNEIKDNTCQLAKRQIGKIMRLKSSGWDLQRLDATEAFKEVMMSTTETPSEENNVEQRKIKKRKKNKKKWVEVWEGEVVEPSVNIVKRFLEE